ncbi:hypothetical protein EJ05DRAFT_541470 [Pseudovirgaria hyperparasitica]|uniref:Uncharacterized protein n=1 Tax=Pseudovirgaria hyperparasitica TaxID=470096 RepID=A0A6A6VTK0_9PEZI|nr:uncharacterized protein EJ05DRAFT_541470 [Pseudovirgaria hyperparasitica]KAF2753902.1 hypothetical protein EJ05DRAFT_541470 [Pseudovirgaria hyperparasitica]
MWTPTYANWPQQNPAQYQPFDNRLHTYNYVTRGTPFDARRSLKSGHTSAACPPLGLQSSSYFYPTQYAYTLPQYHYVQAPIAAAQPRYVYQQPYHRYNYAGTAIPTSTAAPTPNPISPAVKPVYVNHGQATHGYNVNHGHGAYGYNHKYYGRTQEEVEYDNRVIATRSGAYEAHDLQPSDPKPDQMFWCREIDGSWTLRTFFTISEDLKPGKWKMDAARGSLVFIREEKKKKCVKLYKNSWGKTDTKTVSIILLAVLLYRHVLSSHIIDSLLPWSFARQV